MIDLDQGPEPEHFHHCPNCWSDWECDDDDCDPTVEDKTCPTCEYENPPVD